MTPGEYVTTSEAAQRLGVAPGTIRQWAARGLLTPAGRLPAGRQSIYRWDDVRAAEAATRTKARRNHTELDSVRAELAALEAA